MMFIYDYYECMRKILIYLFIYSYISFPIVYFKFKKKKLKKN